MSCFYVTLRECRNKSELCQVYFVDMVKLISHFLCENIVKLTKTFVRIGLSCKKTRFKIIVSQERESGRCLEFVTSISRALLNNWNCIDFIQEKKWWCITKGIYMMAIASLWFPETWTLNLRKIRVIVYVEGNVKCSFVRII